MKTIYTLFNSNVSKKVNLGCILTIIHNKHKICKIKPTNLVERVFLVGIRHDHAMVLGTLESCKVTLDEDHVHSVFGEVKTWKHVKLLL